MPRKRQSGPVEWLRLRVERSLRFRSDLWVSVTHRPWWHWVTLWLLRRVSVFRWQQPLNSYSLAIGNEFSRSVEFATRIHTLSLRTDPLEVPRAQYPDGSGGLQEFAFTAPPQLAALVRDAVICPVSATTIIEFQHIDGRTLMQAICAQESRDHTATLSLFRDLAMAPAADDEVYLPVRADGNYHHWVCEDLCQILYAIDLLATLRHPWRPRFLVSHSSPWLDEVLSCYGLEAAEVGPGYRRYPVVLYVDRLRNYLMTAPDLHRLRSLARRLTPPHPDAAEPRRIYVARGRGLRAMPYEEKLADWLIQEWGFTHVFAAGPSQRPLTLKENIDFFAGAEIVVGPHGAGLTNILWSERKATVVELAFRAYCGPGNALQASLAGHDYHCCWIDSESPTFGTLTAVQRQLAPILQRLG